MAKLIISNKSRVWVLVAALIMALMATTATISAQGYDNPPKPDIRGIFCETGDSEFICEVTNVVGGFPPYSYEWTPRYHAYIMEGKYEERVFGTCIPTSFTIRLKVVDSAGQIVQKDRNHPCSSAPWP